MKATSFCFRCWTRGKVAWEKTCDWERREKKAKLINETFPEIFREVFSLDEFINENYETLNLSYCDERIILNLRNFFKKISFKSKKGEIRIMKDE